MADFCERKIEQGKTDSIFLKKTFENIDNG